MDSVEVMDQYWMGYLNLLLAMTFAISFVADVVIYKSATWLQRLDFLVWAVAWTAIGLASMLDLLPKQWLSVWTNGVVGTVGMALGLVGFFVRPEQRWANWLYLTVGAYFIFHAAEWAVKALKP